MSTSVFPVAPASQPPAGPLHWVKPPQQARSQKTLERLLDAAEDIIGDRGVAALTVSEVVRRAESSVGAFYARFIDKDALLATLHERSCAEALATAELALDPARWKHADLSRVILEVIRFTGSLCRERRGLLVAFVALAASSRPYADRRAALEAQIAERLERFFESRRDEIAHPDLHAAAQVSIRMILGSLEYGALVHGPDEAAPLDGDRFSAELTRAVNAYLGIPESGGRAVRGAGRDPA